MARAEFDQRALRRDLLLARAAAERHVLADRLGALRTLSHQGLPGLLLRGDHPLWLKISSGLWRLFRQQPWLASTLVGGVARLLRARATRRAALATLAAGGLWWWFRRGATPAARPRDPSPPR